jgi:hypothetical protein
LKISAQAAQSARTALAGERKLKVSNPFQISGAVIGNPQFNRRERFKKVFFAVLAIHIILFLTLLIQGCRTDQDRSSLPPDAAVVTAQN